MRQAEDKRKLEVALKYLYSDATAKVWRLPLAFWCKHLVRSHHPLLSHPLNFWSRSQACMNALDSDTRAHSQAIVGWKAAVVAGRKKHAASGHWTVAAKRRVLGVWRLAVRESKQHEARMAAAVYAFSHLACRKAFSTWCAPFRAGHAKNAIGQHLPEGQVPRNRA